MTMLTDRRPGRDGAACSRRRTPGQRASPQGTVETFYDVNDPFIKSERVHATS